MLLKNPTKLADTRKALEQIGRGTLLDIANELDTISPKSGGHHWAKEEVRKLIRGESWATNDADSPEEFVFTPTKADREHFSISRWWDR